MLRFIYLLQITNQIPLEKQVIETGVKWPVKLYRRKTPFDLIKGYEESSKKTFQVRTPPSLLFIMGYDHPHIRSSPIQSSSDSSCIVTPVFGASATARRRSPSRFKASPRKKSRKKWKINKNHHILSGLDLSINLFISLLYPGIRLSLYLSKWVLTIRIEMNESDK